VFAWNAQAKFSAFQYDNAGVLTTIAGATDFSEDKVSDTNVMYGVGVDGKIYSPDKPILRPDMVADEVIFALVASPESVTPVRPS
jgi:hypothetical protein